jgi:hypothetical protein
MRRKRRQEMKQCKTLMLVVPLLILFCNVSIAYSEEKRFSEQSERYKIYVVEKLDDIVPSPQSGYIPVAATGTKNNYLLVDSYTGNTWILTNTGSRSKNEDGKELTLTSFAWEPIFFKTDVKPLWTNGLSTTPK